MVKTIIFYLYFFGITLAHGDSIKWVKKKIIVEINSQKIEVVDKFIFTNTTKDDLQIIKVDSSCGCTVAHFKNEVKPKETGEISFKVKISKDTPQKQGRLTVTLMNMRSQKRELYNVYFKVERSNFTLKVQKEKMNHKDYEKVVFLNKVDGFKKQITCPFIDLPIKEKYYHEEMGIRIYTCCEPCLVRVKNNPGLAIKKLIKKYEIPSLVTEKSESKSSVSSFSHK